MVVGYRNSHSSNCMFPQGVLLSLNGGMWLHSFTAHVDFERKHGLTFYYIMIMNWHHVFNSFSLYCTRLKLLYNEMSSVKYSWVEKSQGKRFFQNPFKPMLFLAFQLAYSYIQYADASWPTSSYDAEEGN